MTDYAQQTYEFCRRFSALLSEDEFISRKSCASLVEDFSSLHEDLNDAERLGVLDAFCGNNGITAADARKFLGDYSGLESGTSASVESHNKDFIDRHLVSDKAYLDGILAPIDPALKLDDEQRRVVLSDDDYTLVIAGAGAGKTTTVAAKVKYLVEKQHVRADQIIVISFTRKAVAELRSRIVKSLGIGCHVTTFHKAGFDILKEEDNRLRKVKGQDFLEWSVNRFFSDSVLGDQELLENLILFFGTYFDAPFSGKTTEELARYISDSDFSTIKGNIGEYNRKVIDSRTGNLLTIAHESVRSMEEVKIANFLYMNGIDYEYEKVYPFTMHGSMKPYTPDFTITQDGKTAYIEHFGITEDGRNNLYSKEELSRYIKSMNDKAHLHDYHGTLLIHTFSEYNDGRELLDHLKDELEKKGFVLRPRPKEEIYRKIRSTEDNKYISKFVKFVTIFIGNFKAQGYDDRKFEEFILKSDNERTKLFLKICRRCYLDYQNRLLAENAIDFSDMINISAGLLERAKKEGRKLDYKYIIIDEYQDISRQRFKFAAALSDISDAKIIAVGDDWQSIYAYAGSDISLFTKFKETFGYGTLLKISHTYRNSQEIIDIAGGFIQKNSSQIKKSLISSKHITDPVIIQSFPPLPPGRKNAVKGGKFGLLGEYLERIVGEIIASGTGKSILLLGRYNFDGYNLSRSDRFRYDSKKGTVWCNAYPDAEIEFMTVHRSKGLGYDNVVIINGMDAYYGFPSKIEDDPIMKLVIRSDNSVPYAEERRLFYVALTRTKNRVYILAPQDKPSDFVRELVHDYSGVALRGTLDPAVNAPDNITRCPICGFPMQYRYNPDMGLRLWICSNEPEICDFMTNNLIGGDMRVLKCDCCTGYLIVKKGKSGPILGCTRYSKGKKGCHRLMNMTYYHEFMAEKMK
jgi:DNA helicase-4